MLNSKITGQNIPFFGILLLILTGFLLSVAIVTHNYIIFMAASGVLLGILVYRSNILPICFLLVIVFFGNWLETVGIFPPQINWANEAIIALLLLKAIFQKLTRREHFRVKFIWVIFVFLGLSFISYQFNRSGLIHALLYFRLLLRYYILFLAIINLDFNEKSMKWINHVLIFLFIIQVPTAVVKLFIYGQGEKAIGTYAPWGGGPSTVIPLIAISFLFAFYFFYRPSKMYFLLALAFIAFGIIGGKRAILVFVPIVVVFLGLFIRDHLRIALKYVVVGLLVILLTGYFSIKFMPSLNPERTFGGSVDLNYLLEFYSGYSTRITAEGKSGGRVATTINVFNILKDEGLRGLLFGIGPGSFIQTRFEGLQDSHKESGSLPIIYGITGLSWLALQTGYISALVYLLLFVVILVKSSRYYKLEGDPYWKSFIFGMIGFSFTFLLIGLAYNTVFINDMLGLVYFLTAAFVMKIGVNLELDDKNVIEQIEIHRNR